MVVIRGLSRWRGNTTAGCCRKSPEVFTSPLAREHWSTLVIVSGAAVYSRRRGEHRTVSNMNTVSFTVYRYAQNTASWSIRHNQTWRFILAGAGNNNRHYGKIVGQVELIRWRGEHRTFGEPHHAHTSSAAGNIKSVFPLRGPAGADPRWRGEHFLLLIGHYHRLLVYLAFGAGTQIRYWQYSRERVYPRWRGEHLTRVEFDGMSSWLILRRRGGTLRRRYNS